MDFDDYDTDKIITAIIVIIVIIALLFVTTIKAYDTVTTNKYAPYTKICTDNPRERMKQNCTTQQDCITKCATRLYEEKNIK